MKNRIQEDLGKMAQLVGQLTADTRQNLEGVGQSVSNHFNLVSQEEFATQKALTEKLGIQLDALERRLESLEAARNPDGSAD